MRLRSRVLYELATVLVVGAVLVKVAELGWQSGEKRVSERVESWLSIRSELGTSRYVTSIAPALPELPGELGTTPDVFGRFLGVPDSELLAPLREPGEIVRVRFNRGGSTVSMRIDFANGARAAFKPDQTNPQTEPRKEIAAYRISQLLGLGQVPPAIPMELDGRELLRKLDGESREFYTRIVREVPGIESGKVRGVLAWWVPEIVPAAFRGERLDHDAGALLWWRALSIGSPLEADEVDFVRQISNMLLFDFLTDNTDRFSGGNALMTPNGQSLLAMDNALAFFLDPQGHEKLQRFARRIERVSQSFVDRLRALDETRLRQVLTTDVAPYKRLLFEEELKAVLKRRDYLIAQIDSLITAHGEREVVYFQ